MWNTKEFGLEWCREFMHCSGLDCGEREIRERNRCEREYIVRRKRMEERQSVGEYVGDEKMGQNLQVGCEYCKV